MLLDELVETCAFGTENEDGAVGEIGLGVRGRGAFVESVNPEAGLLELIKSAADIGDAGYGEVLEGAGSRTGDSFGERGRTALRDNHGIRTDGVGRANDGAEVVGIFDTIEDDEEMGIAGNGREVDIAVSSAECDNSLMRDAAGGAVEGFAGLEADGDLGSAAEIDNFLNTGAGAAFGDEDLIEGAGGAEGFPDGMNAGQEGGGGGARSSTIGRRRAGGGWGTGS